MARKLWVVFVILFGVAPARASPLRIGIALEWLREDTGTSVSGMIQLELPLDRWARPSPRALAEAPPPAFAEAPPPTPREMTPEAEVLTPMQPAAAASEPAPRRPSAPLLDARVVRDVVSAALRASRTDSAEARLDGLATRARTASALPELSLRAARSTDQSLRLSPADGRTLDATQTGGVDLLFEARASWRLDRLVFADEELRVEALRNDRAQRRDRLVALVLERLFAWQRARTKLVLAELEPDARLVLELEQAEAELALDVLTAGFFGERLRRRAPAAVPVTP